MVRGLHRCFARRAVLGKRMARRSLIANTQGDAKGQAKRRTGVEALKSEAVSMVERFGRW
jgi:hypothetical protein